MDDQIIANLIERLIDDQVGTEGNKLVAKGIPVNWGTFTIDTEKKIAIIKNQISKVNKFFSDYCLEIVKVEPQNGVLSVHFKDNKQQQDRLIYDDFLEFESISRPGLGDRYSRVLGCLIEVYDYSGEDCSYPIYYKPLTRFFSPGQLRSGLYSDMFPEGETVPLDNFSAISKVVKSVTNPPDMQVVEKWEEYSKNLWLLCMELQDNRQITPCLKNFKEYVIAQGTQYIRGLEKKAGQLEQELGNETDEKERQGRFNTNNLNKYKGKKV